MRLRLTVPKAAFTAGALTAFFGAARADVTATRTLEDSVRVSGGRPPVVIFKNVFGSIRVTAHDRDTVDMTATETIHGDLQADIDRARAEVHLRTESEGRPSHSAFGASMTRATATAIVGTTIASSTISSCVSRAMQPSMWQP
jgi:hypothetical protein